MQQRHYARHARVGVWGSHALDKKVGVTISSEFFFGSNRFRPGPFLEFQSHNLFPYHSFVFFCFHGSHLSVMGKCVLDQSVFSVFGQNGAIWIMCP